MCTYAHIWGNIWLHIGMVYLHLRNVYGICSPDKSTEWTLTWWSLSKKLTWSSSNAESIEVERDLFARTSLIFITFGLIFLDRYSNFFQSSVIIIFFSNKIVGFGFSLNLRHRNIFFSSFLLFNEFGLIHAGKNDSMGALSIPNHLTEIDETRLSSGPVPGLPEFTQGYNGLVNGRVLFYWF